jgi:hypothetical protein
MSEEKNNKKRSLVPSQSDPGFVTNLAHQFRLVLRLMGDSRVPWWLKALPLGTLVYFVAPDLMPVNPIDDALVIGLGAYAFVEMCPPHVVEEHRKALWGPKEDEASETEGEVVDAEFTEDQD